MNGRQRRAVVYTGSLWSPPCAGFCVHYFVSGIGVLETPIRKQSKTTKDFK